MVMIFNHVNRTFVRYSIQYTCTSSDQEVHLHHVRVSYHHFPLLSVALELAIVLRHFSFCPTYPVSENFHGTLAQSLPNQPTFPLP